MIGAVEHRGRRPAARPRPVVERQLQPHPGAQRGQRDLRDPCADAEDPVPGVLVRAGARWLREQHRAGQDQHQHEHQRDAEQPLDGAALPLAAPAIASMVSVWMMPSMVAKPGLRDRHPAEHAPAHPPGRPGVGVSGRPASYSRLRLALRVSVSSGGTVICSGKLVGGQQVGPAATAGDQLAVLAGVARVVVQVAGDQQPHVRPGRREDRPDEVVDRVVRLGLVGRLDPGRRRRHQDDPVAPARLLGRLLEVQQLRVVDVGPELLVDREQPPVRRAV